MITENGIVPVKGGQYKVLSQDQIDHLQKATMEVLEEIGINVQHNEALDLMKGNGCEVNFDKQIVRIPESVLNKFIAMAPSEFLCAGRDPKYDINLKSNDDVYSLGGAGALNYLDLDGKRKPSTVEALKDFIRLEDTLENLDVAHFLLTPQDIDQSANEMTIFGLMLQDQQRHFYTLPGGFREGVEFQLKMAEVLVGSKENFRKRPIYTSGLCLTHPLTHRYGFIEELWASGEYGIPAYVEADSIAGACTPMTISGCAVEINANVLAGVAVAQMKNPGAPCCYASSSGILDMNSLDLAGSAPESTLIHMVSTQLAHHNGLPYYGANTPDSKLPDAQMGLEAMQHIQMLALGGCNLIHVSIGNLEMMKLASFEACLIANDIFGAVYRILQGVDCSNEAIGVDVFKEVRHDSRYLETMHAAKYCRANERWSPKLIDRNSWDAWWQQTGGKDMAQRANEMARKILKEHHPEYVTAKERKEINKICKEAENWLTNKRKNSD